jgi:hypothetical protein
MQQPQADEFELTVTDTPEPAARPGFHETRTRTFYVTAAGSVYLLAAPGQRAMLQAVEQLPPEATPSPASATSGCGPSPTSPTISPRAPRRTTRSLLTR